MSLRPIRTMSDWLIQTFFRSLPLMWQRRFTPSKHIASKRPLPSILVTWAYSWPSSLNTSSLLSPSFSFFPLLLFFPPFPLFLGIVQLFVSLSQDHRKSPKSLPPLIVRAGLNCGLGVASNNLHSVYFSKLTVLAEFDLLEHESPHVVTKTVGVQLLSLEMKLSLHPGSKSVVDRLVKLNQHSESKGRA